MIHYGKDPHEDKVIIEVSDEDLLHLKNVLMAMPLPERRQGTAGDRPDTPQVYRPTNAERRYRCCCVKVADASTARTAAAMCLDN